MKLKHLMLAVCMSALGVAFADVIQPSGDKTGAMDTAAIQAALDAAAAESPAGTVTLGEGLFQVNVQLTVSGGVTLTGQGYDKTVVKYVGATNTGSSRVVTVSDGSTLSHMALTGASVGQNQYTGGCVMVSGTGGTISWCCITNNLNQQSNGGGIGIWSKGKVRIDHTIVANNTAGTGFDACGGGIGTRPGGDGLQLEIESCLIYGNTVGKASCGAGIGLVNKKASETSDSTKVTAVIRNTTIADNQVIGTGKGGGLFSTQKNVTLVNCIFADNTDASGASAVAFNLDAVKTVVEGKTSNCLFGNGTTGFGTNPVCVEGSAGFVAPAAGDYHLR